MTKRAIGILLVFLTVLSSISVAFAAEAPQTCNNGMIEEDPPLSESGPVTVQIHNSLEIEGSDNEKIKPIEAENLNEREAYEKSTDSGISIRAVSKEEISIDESFLESLAVQAYDDVSDPNTNGVKASLCDIIAYDLKRAAGQPSPFIALNDSDIEVTIANVGDVSTGNFTVGIKINGNLAGSFNISNLATYTGIIYTITLQQMPEGIHTIQIVADYNNTAAESNESNNTVSAGFQWVGVPNLKAELIWADGTPPFEVGNGVDFTFRVRNSGNGKVNGDCSIELRVDGSVLATWTVTDWPAQTYLEDSFSLTFHQTGTYAVEMRADPYNRITESNESDNNVSNSYKIVVAPQIRVRGCVRPSFRYSHSSGATATATPLKGFKVKIMDQDILFHDELATVTTDANGNFDVYVNNQPSENGVDLFVKLEFDDDVMDIRSQSLFATPYSWESTIRPDIQAGEYNFGTLPLSNLPANLEGAFSIWYWIKKAHDYYVQYSSNSSSIPKAHIKWEDGVGEGSSHNSGTISIAGHHADADCFDADIILHEYGHLIMAYTAGHVPGAGGTHNYEDPSNLATAYSEAWAHFFSCSVRNNNRVYDTNPTSGYGGNLEIPAAIRTSGTVVTTPLVANYEQNAMYELNAGAVLWDLFDNVQDGTDTVSHSFSRVDNVMAGNNSRHIYDYYDRWFLNPGSTYTKEALWNVFESRKCSYDLEVPTVSISCNGLIVNASASDNIAVNEYKWYVDGNYYSNGSGSSASLDGSLLPPGFHHVEFRAYDPEGLKAFYTNSDGSYSRPRIDRYGSSTVAIYVPFSKTQKTEEISKDEVIKDHPKMVKEHHSSMLKAVPENEKVIVEKINLLNIGDSSRYTATVGKNEDLKIYSHIVGIMKNINIYAPDGTLYKTCDYISPDKPVVIENAEPGEWTIEFAYLTQKDIGKYAVNKEMSSSTTTPVSLVVTSVPSAVDLELPKITNNPDYITDTLRKGVYDRNIKVYLDDKHVKGGIVKLNEGINKVATERVKDGFTSEKREYTITLDTIAPEIKLHNQEKITTSDKEVLIHGSYSTDVESLTINGESIQISEFGSGFAEYYLIDSGINEFLISATDKAGNKSEKIVIVYKK
jgi:hypothetical protein